MDNIHFFIKEDLYSEVWDLIRLLILVMQLTRVG